MKESEKISKKEFYENLPKKRMASGVLIRDNQKRILMLQPSYKRVLEIPGGVVENNESPFEACRREVQEEIGLNIELGRMLCVDYNKSKDKKAESLMFIFYGGKIQEEMKRLIKLDGEEILSYEFMTLKEIKGKTTDTLFKRIEKCIKAIENNCSYYLENQKAVNI